MFVRLMAAMMFTAAGAAAGLSLSQKLRNERELCRSVGELLRNSSLRIRFSGTDVFELSSELKQCSSLSRLTFLQALPEHFVLGEDFHSCWQAALDGQVDIPSDERRILRRFGELLGSCDTEGQLSGISTLAAELEQLDDLRSENYLRKGRLFRSVGLLMGVMTGILVI